jgi:hypothetical protein
MAAENALSRLWFMSQGCKRVPLEDGTNRILWGHPDGYFLNWAGQKLAHTFSPSSRRGFTAANLSSGGFRGGCYPKMRHFGNKVCHHLMALTFYGSRPTYFDENGKEYVGIIHHLIPDKTNYRPANLLCWLTKEQHKEADRRQRALRKVVPDGNLYVFTYERLRWLQDPRTTCREVFEVELAKITSRHYHHVDPLTLAGEEPDKYI